MTMIKRLLLAAAAVALAGPALADADVKLGTLTCVLNSVENDVVYTDEAFDCTFQAESGGASESYTGQIKQVGLNLSVTKGYTMTWYVLVASLDDYKAGALAGTYLGASADAAAGSGGGVDYLVGGFNNLFNLQPWAAGSESGTGVSLGIETFELKQ